MIVSELKLVSSTKEQFDAALSRFMCMTRLNGNFIYAYTNKIDSCFH